MRMLIYEALTGGGQYQGAVRPPLPASWLVEGLAMLGAIAADAGAVPELELVGIWDAQLPWAPPAVGVWRSVDSERAHDAALVDLARQVDVAMLIAPEANGQLVRISSMVRDVGCPLLGPTAEVMAWASDKQLAFEHLRRHGVRVPYGFVVPLGTRVARGEVRLPCVVKPRDGAGSDGVRLLNDDADWESFFPCGRDMRVEAYFQGTPASVAVLSGPAGSVILAPCLQQLASDGTFAYLGGSVLDDADLIARARGLADTVLPLLRGGTGFAGLDLVLGRATDGRDDVVIEVNPRLTTSYLGLRKSTDSNLVHVMLDVFQGRQASVEFPRRGISFSADGRGGGEEWAGWDWTSAERT